MKAYYEAYDKRYTQIHTLNLEWASGQPSPILEDVIRRFGISKEDRILELGCGEGRDAFHLLDLGYNVYASDISREAVHHCRQKRPEYRERIFQLDACRDALVEKYTLLYSVAVIHMLVRDDDRNRFLSFLKRHLADDGIALILTMGDGVSERATDISRAFEDAPRTHGQTGRSVQVAETSMRMVSFPAFEAELARNQLEVLEKGLTSVEPDFPFMMYAVVK